MLISRHVVIYIHQKDKFLTCVKIEWIYISMAIPLKQVTDVKRCFLLILGTVLY